MDALLTNRFDQDHAWDHAWDHAASTTPCNALYPSRAYHLTMAALKILACLVAAACVHGQDSPAAPAAGTAPADSDAAPERPAEPITGNRLSPSRPE